MLKKKMMSPFNRLSKQSKQKTIQAKYLMFATFVGLLVITLITTNQSSTSVRSSLRALKVQPTNATILPDIREVLDLVEDKSGNTDGVVPDLQMHDDNNEDSGSNNDDTVADFLHEAAIDSQVAVTDKDDKTSNVDTIGTTDNTLSLQERLLARSIEVRDMISETLSEAAAHIPSPKYFHFNPQYEEEGPTADHSCDQEDAYVGVAVDGWLPPQYGYPMESLNEWYIKYDISMKKIKNKDAGGSELRDFAAKATQKLRELRHSLFCKD